MMASSSELTLDCKPHSYSMLLKSIGEQTDQTQKLEEFLSHLEEEKLKIDAFKRELPLCMQLLSNAMESSRQQLQSCRANQGPRPILEEFIPLKNSISEGSEKTSSMSDKANWMTSAQLWSQASDGNKAPSTIQSPKESDIGFNVSPKLDLDTKQRSGGAFLPFSKERNLSGPSPFRALPDLALSSVEKEVVEEKKCVESENGIQCLRRENGNKGGNGGMVIEEGKGVGAAADSQITTTTTTMGNNSSSQAHRKARRCWSPDLHRRFVNALQMLGGSQVATPKQIRELMKVEGLTNDEVKSHLQKYRLHTRRPGPGPSPQVTGPTPLLVLGGIWVPPEYTTAAAAVHHGGGPTLYGAAHASQHYCAQTMPQEFYSAPPPQPHHQLHNHTLHHQLHMYNPSSQTHSSPESDIRGGIGDQSESIEDGNSENSSWKADSGGENGGERKGLVQREDGEESNGSEVTLKF